MLGSVSKHGRRRRSLIVEALEDRRLMSVSPALTITPDVTTTAVITVTPTAPVDIADPLNVSAPVGKKLSFTAAAEGIPVPTVQWQSSADGTTFFNIPGATSLTYTFTATVGDDNKFYQAVFSNTAGNTTTASAELTLVPTAVPILVTSEPVPQTVGVGETASFTATSNRKSASVQWQVSSDGSQFANIAGATSPTYTVTAAATDEDNEYRAVFSNATDSAASEPAKLTVLTADTGIFVLQQPAPQNVVAGQPVVFTANASVAATAVQWQVSTDGGYLFSDVPNQNLINDSFIPTLSQNGDLFRAIFSNSLGSVATNYAELTVVPAVVPPTATIIAPNVTSAGGNGEAITVIYTGTLAAINTSTIAPSNITVTGPSGQIVPTSVFSISTTGDSTSVTYTITPPNGTWRSTDDGNYAVIVNSGAVTDTNGVGNTSATASFKVQADTLLVVGLTATPTPNTNGQSESFTATLTNVGPSGPAPTGSVTFYSNGVAIGTSPLAANGSATLIASITQTTQAITAIYNGDSTHPAASSGLPLQILSATPLAITPSLTGVLPEVAVAGEKTPITQTLSITNVSGALFHEHLTIELYLAAGSTIDSNSVLLKSTTMPFRLKNQNFKTLHVKLPRVPSTVLAGSYHFVVVLQGSDGRTSTAASSQTIAVTA
jgi:hypothetical protein